MQTTKTLVEVGQPEPKINLVQSVPVEDGTKLSQLGNSYSWEDLLGLSALIDESDYS